MTAKQGIPLNRRSVILFDSMFIVGFLMLFYATNGFHKGAIVGMLLISALGTCIKLHADYYKKTKRIY
jgi:hypothetical protein